METIRMKRVESSNIEHVGYSESKKNLLVKFKKSGVYVYLDVPKEVYDNLLKSESIGSFVRNNIVNKYEFKKI